jgi:Uma2 family endonuclease
VKFANYQTIETLQEYVLISQWEQRVEVFRRCDRKFWLLQTYTAGESIELQSINLQISIDAIYEDVALSETNSEVDTEE